MSRSEIPLDLPSFLLAMICTDVFLLQVKMFIFFIWLYLSLDTEISSVSLFYIIES